MTSATTSPPPGETQLGSGQYVPINAAQGGWSQQPVTTPKPPGPATTSSSGSTQPYSGPGAQAGESSSTFPRLLSDLDTMLNARGSLGSLNVVDDVKVFIARGTVVVAGIIMGTAGLVLVVSSIWGKTPAPIQDAAEATGGAAVAAAVA